MIATQQRNIDRSYLLNDEQVATFIVKGFMLVKPDLPRSFHDAVYEDINALDGNPGNGILDAVPKLYDVWNDPTVVGALASLLGHDYEMNAHRHCHTKPAGSGYMRWHQDSTNQRHHEIRVCLGMYYPQDVTPNMGPTIVVPGTQYRNAPTDRMQHYTNIRGQVPVVVEAGTVAITHYDIWHATGANSSDRARHMLKFLFHRASQPTGPSWNHDPAKIDELRAMVGNMPAVPCSQSDNYKERSLRRHALDHMLGLLEPAAAVQA